MAGKIRKSNLHDDVKTMVTDMISEQALDSANFDSVLSSKTTDDITEGSTNQYYTTARFDSDFSAGGSFTSDVSFADGVKAVFGDSSDLQIYHNSSNNHSYIIENGSGSLITQAENLIVQNTSGANNIVARSGAEVELFYNGAQKLETSSSGVNVSGRLQVSGGGTSTFDNLVNITDETNDTRIAFTRSDTGASGWIGIPNWDTDALKIYGPTASSNELAANYTNQRWSLYGGGSAKLQTTPTGVFVTGELTADSATIPNLSGDVTFTGNLQGPSTWYIDPAPVDSDAGLLVIRGDLQVDGTTTTVNSTTVSINDKNIVLADSAANAAEADGAGITVNGASATITYDASNDEWDFNKPINIPGGTTTGHVSFGDNDKAIFGDGSDLQIYHDGNHSYISDQGTGRLYLRASNDLFISDAAGSKHKAVFTTNGAVDLRYDGSRKLATTSTGVDITGTIEATGNTNTEADAIVKAISNNGTVNTSLTFGGLAGSANLKFYTNGTTERLKITSGGDISFYEDTGTTAKFFWDASTKRLGIGTTTPAQSLEVVGTASEVVRLRSMDNTGSNYLSFYHNSGNRQGYVGYGAGNDDRLLLVQEKSDNIEFYTGGSTKMAIDSGGNVGIGETNPSYRFEVNHSSTNVAKFSGATNAYVDFYEGTGINLRIQSSGQSYIRTTTAHDLGLGANSSTTQLYLKDGGNVGIGTNSPNAKLDVRGQGLFHGSSGSYVGTNVGAITINSNMADNTHAFSQGLVFTNNTSGAGPWTHAAITTEGSTGYRGDLVFGTDGDGTNNTTGVTEKMRIKHNGNVGIGTTNPHKKLQVKEASTSSGAYFPITVGGSSHIASYAAGIGFDPEGYGYRNKMAIVAEGITQGYSRGKFHFLLNNTSDNSEATLSNAKMTITEDGRVGVGNTNPLYPITVGHSNPNNGIVQQLRNNTSNGNGAFLHFDINNVGDYSIGMPNNDNSFVIGKDLGNTGDQIVKIKSDGSILTSHGSYPSRELTFNWSKYVSTSYVDLVTVEVPNAHYGYFYEIITTGGDWSNHSSARSYHKGMVNGYNGYGGHTKIESSGPYGSNISINCVFVDGAGETKLQIKLDTGAVTLETYVRLVGRVGTHTIHR